MTVLASRLPLSLDPLVAEANRRTRRRRLFFLVLAILIGGVATAAALALAKAAHTTNPFAIRTGMTAREVRNIAGLPSHTYANSLVAPGTTACWSYRAVKANTNIDGVGACFASGRVLRVITYVRG